MVELRGDLNPWPPHCERGALPTELQPVPFRGLVVRGAGPIAERPGKVKRAGRAQVADD